MKLWLWQRKKKELWIKWYFPIRLIVERTHIFSRWHHKNIVLCKYLDWIFFFSGNHNDDFTIRTRVKEWTNWGKEERARVNISTNIFYFFMIFLRLFLFFIANVFSKLVLSVWLPIFQDIFVLFFCCCCWPK